MKSLGLKTLWRYLVNFSYWDHLKQFPSEPVIDLFHKVVTNQGKPSKKIEKSRKKLVGIMNHGIYKWDPYFCFISQY